MELLTLFRRLPLILQDKIKLYYLSYGTNVCRILKGVINTQKRPDETLWNMVIRHHGYLKCRIVYNCIIPDAFYELELILLDRRRRLLRNLDQPTIEYMIRYMSEKLQHRIIRRHNSLRLQ
jgi:hypothetical protein